MPWNDNEWIRLCNPVKAKEYLALGKPIVTTYYPEVEVYKDVIYVAHSYDEFTSAIVEALEERDGSLKQRRRKRVEEETWDNKVQMLINQIDTLFKY